MADVVSRYADSIGAGAPADKTEITPEMKQAGAFAWAQGDSEFDSPEEIVSRIFRAMMEARKRACRV
jgi:hypothetical protein